MSIIIDIQCPQLTSHFLCKIPTNILVWFLFSSQVCQADELLTLEYNLREL